MFDMKNINEYVATTLKRLRSANHWSLDKTSVKTGVSKAMLGQIERGESSPTISTLWKIATGFEVPFSALIEPQSLTTELNTTDQPLSKVTVFPYDNECSCEMFMIDIKPNTTHFSKAHKKGVIEHVLVIKGTISILVNDSWKQLHEGQGLRFDASIDHGYRNSSDQLAKFHNIVHYINSFGVTR